MFLVLEQLNVHAVKIERNELIYFGKKENNQLKKGEKQEIFEIIGQTQQQQIRVCFSLSNFSKNDSTFLYSLLDE